MGHAKRDLQNIEIHTYILFCLHGKDDYLDLVLNFSALRFLYVILQIFTYIQ